MMILNITANPFFLQKLQNWPQSHCYLWCHIRKHWCDPHILKLMNQITNPEVEILKMLPCDRFKTLMLGTIHLRRRQIFTIFDPYPPTVGSFLVLSVGKFGKFLTPPPLRHADVLNGWSLTLSQSGGGGADYAPDGCCRKTIILVLKTSTENPATTRKCIIMIFLVTKKVDMKYLCQLIHSWFWPIVFLIW